MKIGKKILSVLLSASMILSMCSTAFATASGTGAGTSTEDWDISWYDSGKKEFKISTAKQLVGLSAIVGGRVKGIARDNFQNKTVKLGDNINMDGVVFYPIGYSGSDRLSFTIDFKAFRGTFDGQGNAISNIKQNGYRDGMGLFGYVKGATIQDLTIENFEANGEYADMGVIAAYVDGTTKFKDITLVGSKFTAKGGATAGVVGWDAGQSSSVTFENIAVDGSNTFASSGGKTTVGGVMGHLSKTSTATFTNCHVYASVPSAANAGMLIGSVEKNSRGIQEQVFVSGTTVGSSSGSADGNDNVGLFGGSGAGTNTDDYEICVDNDGDHKCDECGKENISPHVYTAKVTKEATCAVGGVKTFTCICGHTYTENIPAKSHTLTNVEAKAATCTDEGYGAYEYCTECEYTTKKSIPATGHNWSNATCEAPKTCTKCRATEGDALEHSYDAVVTAPTCTEDGYTTYTCSNCNDSYVADKVTALGHSYDAVVTAPTCTVGGYTTYTCACGDTYVADETDALGHTSGETVVENNVNADCENGGSYDNVVYCAVCEAELSRETVTVDAKGHTPGEAATCTTAQTCTVCGTVLAAAAGHTHNGTVTAPTCTVGGYTTYTCACGDTYVAEEVPAVGHSFEKKFNGDFLYRVGNQNAVELGSLFKASGSVENATVKVTVENVAGNASGIYTANSTWTDGTIEFEGTGVVYVSIKDKNCSCEGVSLELEVVDAVNATTATSATKNNVVLLNDCGFSSLEVSGGYTLYGNGFTMTCSSDSAALDMGYSFVTLKNGTLDNVQIVCPNFDYAVLYKSNMTESGNRSETTDRTRYFNVKSGVMVSGNSQILNSRISGGRAAVNVTGGNVLIDNSRIELGAVASVLVGSANSLTLRDVTLVQKPTASTYDSSKTLMGFSVLYMCDAAGKATPTTIEGSFVQQAWVNADDKQYVPIAGHDIVDGIMKETAFIHSINGKDSLNLGFAYMPEDVSSSITKPDNITDNRTDKETIPYEMKGVSVKVSILSTTVYIYSYKNTNGTADSFKTESEYKPNKYGDIITVTYSDTTDGLEHGKSFGTDGWVYELKVDLDKASGYKLDFSKLSMAVNGTTITDFKVNGSAKPTSLVAVTAGGDTYILTATVDGKEYTANFKVTGTETSKESPSKISGPTTAGFGVAKSYGGDWSGAADVLTGVKVKYWSVAENKYVEFDFSNFTVPGNAGKLNGTNSYWEYTHTNNDFTLKVTNTVAIHSGKSVYGMPIRGTDGKLYFTISSTNGYVGSGTTSRAVTMQYEFTDNNGGEKLTFTHTFNISYNKDDQYSYSDLSGSGKLTKLEGSSGGGGGCVTPDTMITLADGSQKRVDSLGVYDQLLVWNMETGKLDSAPILFVDMEEEAEFEVVELYFSDETVVDVIYEHGFWDYDLNRYVYLDENAAAYIGHTFAKQSENGLEKVKLTDVVITTETTEAWSPVTVGHLCYFVNDMLSMPGGVGGLFNIFEVDPETMTYDMEKMAEDIETYGLYTYEELNAIESLSEDMFESAGGAYLKVSMGKGNMTMDELVTMIRRYSVYFAHYTMMMSLLVE